MKKKKKLKKQNRKIAFEKEQLSSFKKITKKITFVPAEKAETLPLCLFKPMSDDVKKTQKKIRIVNPTRDGTFHRIIYTMNKKHIYDSILHGSNGIKHIGPSTLGDLNSFFSSYALFQLEKSKQINTCSEKKKNLLRLRLQQLFNKIPFAYLFFSNFTDSHFPKTKVEFVSDLFPLLNRVFILPEDFDIMTASSRFDHQDDDYLYDAIGYINSILTIGLINSITYM